MKENEEVINAQKTIVSLHADEIQNIEPSAPMQSPSVVVAEKKVEIKPKEPELSGIELLKSMYNKDENKKNTKIKGDLICIVYGKHMKWLKKNSRQLRPKAESVKAALQQNEIERQQSLQKEEEQVSWHGQQQQQVEDVAPAAFADQEFKPPPP